MRSAPWLITATLLASGLAAGHCAAAGNGLVVSGGKGKSWPTWQGRLSMGVTHAAWPTDAAQPQRDTKLSGLGLLGDYYFNTGGANLSRDSGFRATSGLMIGSQSAALLSGTGEALSAPASGRLFSSDRRALGLHVPPAARTEEETAHGATPYVGLGYSSLSAQGGWGFSADIGVMLQPSDSVKLGATRNNNQNLEDMLRDMRLSPLMYLSVSYSF
jgi:hypothetical protein